MPTSATEGKKRIKEWVTSQDDIKVIVDVGPGEGTYRDLLGPDYIWIGIEAYEPYVKEYGLEEKYLKLHVADVREAELPLGDLIIFGDVLEHMSKEDAYALLEKAKAKYKHIIASVPIGEWPQDAVGGNEYEVHHATYFMRELEEMFADFPIKEKEGAIGIFIR